MWVVSRVYRGACAQLQFADAGYERMLDRRFALS
jgi:hypothetical protein